MSAGDSPLTPREADVLELAADGTPVDEIAKHAALTPGTVQQFQHPTHPGMDRAHNHRAAARHRADHRRKRPGHDGGDG
ncbi:MAG: LuxR C-terminal-related transcriptional regulator [Streptosporangiaceae bacterium]